MLCCAGCTGQDHGFGACLQCLCGTCSDALPYVEKLAAWCARSCASADWRVCASVVQHL